MSGNDSGKNTTTIKIAAKSASKREGTADIGPGDPNAAPSEMPEPVSIPPPPSPSELVVKSSAKTKDSRAIKTIMDPVSLPKSRGASASTALKSAKTLKTLSGGAAKTADLMDPAGASGGGVKTVSGSGPSARGPSAKSSSAIKSGGGAKSLGTGGPEASTSATKGADDEAEPSGAQGSGAAPSQTKSVQTMKSGKSVATSSKNTQADSEGPGAEQDLIEDGETEVEHPSPSPSPSASSDRKSESPASGGIDTAPPSSGGGTPKLSIKSKQKSDSSRASSSPRHSHHHVHHHAHKHHHAKKGKQKFRYHKRVTVRTHGKTSPSEVMDQVNARDHKAGITPSSIGEMDTEELMRRAGIKGSKRAHWRVRLRQTKRTTKNGKTVTETKIAYRDSEGNKSIKTSTSPDCPKCGKRLEECKCTSSN